MMKDSYNFLIPQIGFRWFQEFRRINHAIFFLNIPAYLCKLENSDLEWISIHLAK